MHPFDEGRILAGLLNIQTASGNDQGVQFVSYLMKSVGWSNLDSALGADEAGRGGDDDTLVAGFASSSEPCQPCVSVEECVVGTTHIENFATGIDQEANPAGIGDLLRLA